MLSATSAALALEVIALTGDVANSTTPRTDGSITATTTDAFAYDPLDPTAALPTQTHPNNYHAESANGTDVFLIYDFTDGPITLATGETFAIDLYGRSECCQNRDDDIDVELFTGGVLTGTVVASSLGVGIPDAAPQHQRVIIGGVGDTFDSFRLTAHDSDGPDNLNAFTLQEIRAAIIDDKFNSLTINRQTGSMVLLNNTDDDINIVGYSLTSVAGSFDQANWTTISGNYDAAPGSGLVDTDDSWTVLTGAGVDTDLSEGEFDSGNGGILPSTQPVDLGTPWRTSPFEDVVAEILLDDGSIVSVPVFYEGTQIVSGDLNGVDGIDAADWNLFKAGQGSDFTGLSQVSAYQLGDLDGDGDHDLADFGLFEEAFDLANGAGSLATLISGSSVPEPSSLLLLTLAGGWALVGSRRKS